MATSLTELGALVQGSVVGDPQTPVHGAAALSDVCAGQITFIDVPEKLARLAASSATAAIVPRGVELSGLPGIQVDNVHAAFTAIFTHFKPHRATARLGVRPGASVSPTAKLGRDVEVYPGAVISDDVEIGDGATIHAGACVMPGCRIGAGVTIYPTAVLYEDTHVGPRSVIHAGAVIGCHGFGYRLVNGRHQLAAQLGNVEIGADVEVGAGTSIDRGTYGPTRIGDGTKIDNQVQIAHNCRIGKHNMICSQVGIAGSTTTGDYVVMAGQVGVRDHVHIGTGAVLSAMAGITQDVPDGGRMMGIPATPERDQKVKQAAFSKLPEMRRQLKALEKAVNELQQATPGIRPQAA
jgi:UDP-3-O-[3-hydroxymyristoyl] glucosamine N-acyltransferase